MLAGVERFVAWRYLRPTRGEGFISVIAGFALVGIALGVGTLIIVLAVMQRLPRRALGPRLGVNGHASIVAGPEGIAGLRQADRAAAQVPGVVRRDALRRGPGHGHRQRRWARCIVRGLRPEREQRLDLRRQHRRRLAGRSGAARRGDDRLAARPAHWPAHGLG